MQYLPDVLLLRSLASFGPRIVIIADNVSLSSVSGILSSAALLFLTEGGTVVVAAGVVVVVVVVSNSDLTVSQSVG